jgi:MoaA/NifB/PqqE/SkfB family radical SAM enzyme
VFGWSEYVFPLVDASETLDFEVGPVVPHPADARELALMIRDVAFLDDAAEVLSRSARHDNLRRNFAEFRRGAKVLESVPPHVRISLARNCNIKPPCVYCQWDFTRDQEEACFDSPADPRSLGSFYETAVEFVDCSIGEPFLVPDFPVVAEGFVQSGAWLSFTTNGLLMTEERYRPLLGRKGRICISLDAPDAVTYAWYRGEGFDRLVGNVRRLCELRNSRGGMPEVYIACLAMRSNSSRVSEVMKLAADMGADGFLLRSLYAENRVGRPPADRGGHYFDYAHERLDLGEHLDLAERLRPLAEELGLDFIVDELHYMRQPGDASQPLCGEPWKTAYILDRGILPCCFTSHPVASWDQRGGLSVEEFVRRSLNSPLMQEIRAFLARGELSAYCLGCGSCPIVRRFRAQVAAKGPQRPPLGPPV